ncbi:aldehyde ferredoxin oxidoreductase family protein [bacterium]|nr:aldehyde ferredoxin oxidoreductase family protein [bacterium]
MTGNLTRFVEVNMTSGKISDFVVSPDYIRDYIGGASLAARLFLDIADPALDPLSEANPLFIMAGPMAGTSFPGSSRFVMCAKSPLTGIWGESASGGSLGADLKKAGIDGLIVTGSADSPVYLFIDDGKIEILSAADLWGMETYRVIDTLRERHAGTKKVSVAAIGPAGENLVKYASVCNDKAHHLGRTGMGAVMGSRNLKALVVRGTGKVPLADEKQFKVVRHNTLETSRDSMVSMSFNQVGTAAAMEMGLMTGDVPIKNWSVGLDDDIGEAIGGSTIAETIVKKRKACFACPIACKPEVVVNHHKYQVNQGPGPEYETCGTFGSMLMNLNLAGLSKANERCNQLGLDTISCGATMAFIMEAVEKGILTKDDLDGLDMTWGNIDDTLKMVEKIAYRKGFGDRAAEGSRSLAADLPEAASEFLVTVKGLELPMHDPRGYHGMGLAYMMSTRGACHLQHSCQAVEQGLVAWDEAGLKEDYEGPSSEGKAEMVFITENIGQLANTLCTCHFVHWAIGMDNLIDGFNAVTGQKYDLKAFMEAGARAWVLKRSIGNLMGVTSADDRLPVRVITPLAEGGSEGTIPDVALMKKEYYALRGLDEQGIPKPAVLDSLKLGFLKDKLFV